MRVSEEDSAGNRRPLRYQGMEDSMNRNIVIVGLVSLFTDISSEMIYPLIPLYLTGSAGSIPGCPRRY